MKKLYMLEKNKLHFWVCKYTDLYTIDRITSGFGGTVKAADTLEEIEKYVQQLIREADIVREQKEQNVPDDEIWIDRTIAMLMAKWKIKWNKLTEVQQRSFKEVLMQSELRKEQLPKKRMRGKQRK